jgi:hypothetical protein
MPKKPTNKLAAQDRTIPLIWDIPEDLMSGYATNMLVQVGEHEFFISFFETPPPVLISPQDIEKLGSVTAECFARIVVAPERMQGFINVLQQQLDVYNKKKAELSPKKKAEAKANDSK